MLEAISILQSRVYRTYPYAKLASERLMLLNKGMERHFTNKEKKNILRSSKITPY
jgi:hypothetical protein